MTGSDSLHSHDDRPFIKDLLGIHAAAIESVREAILRDSVGRDVYYKGGNPKRYDDIFFLRFVLSHKGKVESASKAALKTIKFRDDRKLNELGDIRHRLRNLGVSNATSSGEPLPNHALYESFCGKNTGMITLPDKDRGIIIYCDVGQIDMDGIAAGMSEEKMKEYILLVNEAIFQILDDTTRRTGRLTKQMKIIDMGNVSLRKLNRAYIKRDAACSKALEDYHPQILGTVFIANAPSWLSSVWTVMKRFFPKRFVEKVDILPTLSQLKKSKDSLKPLLRYVSEEHLSERYGGKSKEWPLPSPSPCADCDVGDSPRMLIG